MINSKETMTIEEKIKAAEQELENLKAEKKATEEAKRKKTNEEMKKELESIKESISAFNKKYGTNLAVGRVIKEPSINSILPFLF